MARAPSTVSPVSFHPRSGNSALAARLRREIEGEVLFDPASRGRYSTDASIYQIDPVGVVVPKTEQDAKIALQIAVGEGVPVLARGAGSSQCGQTVGAALVIDHSKFLNKIVSFDKEAATAVVQPGVVLDALNAQLRRNGLWFPVDVSTSAQATLGGMAGNNSCGSRSIRYGNMVHNVLGIDALLADGSEHHFGVVPADISRLSGDARYVKLGPTAVELVDRTMIGLARGNPAYRAVVEKFVRGDPDAILLVEFVADDRDGPADKLERLAALMADLGHPGSVIRIIDAALQRDVWEVRKAGLNIMMSMKGDGKPVSFIEDCAVPLENLAEYTDSLTQVFRKHGTEGTWYAHASVGTLHVRPILDMKRDGAKKMRAIAEEACALVKKYKGAAYSGEHGDGLVRSEWIAPIIGERLVRALEEIKNLFDPKGLLNPGKIVRPSKQDDRTLFRFKPGYAAERLDTVLDWSEWSAPGAASEGFAAAVEMCNNNGHCRKFDAGTMCPSFRATGDERHLTRGRANSLRLALSGQLGPEAFTSGEMYETLDLCVSCKRCRRECPTGVDMAKMKIEFLHHYHARHGYAMEDTR